MPSAPLYDLPDEVFLQINDLVHGRPKESISNINTTQPIADPLTRVCKRFRQSVRDEYLSTTTFLYISPVGSCHKGSSFQCPARDLLRWLESVLGPCSENQDEGGVRKLCLKMYASEFLWLFAPLDASQLLDMPSPNHRHSWSRATEGLKRLRVNELKITILEHTCPRPCEAGQFGGNHRSYRTRPIDADGSAPRHFTPDHRWVVKAVLETMSHLSPSAIEFSWSGKPVPRSEVERIAGCSWTLLHSSSSFHTCDTLAYDGSRYRSWADVQDEKTVYRVPVVWANESRAGSDCEADGGERFGGHGRWASPVVR
ncbi:hypothetical protein LTR91_014759 [Friedmanniomyces endolithicus]|uniref:F-box domain-containing protein n=1 Tax=Friedmanniomyces endolithicus TaxID=329885 RepID=A0AAN6KB92_9PEZI|nr:hypothetical protein LTR94_006308 [Friedmanniomyces endolithicus]KAK0804130.1 hypothetical protein LTR38_005914 [Friedmanniomyces endolithicus]KAK0811057.1 hypothetical protein LTR59_002068 [Friedmanniomyces endolithicus]KAK0815294.1 hypothetical protein LTR75_003963 [Friedmanniomyces endolithicus]KAK0853014.1 hypothetical protein LTR03_003161 [Friedmanniomyces endolithicus]